MKNKFLLTSLLFILCSCNSNTISSSTNVNSSSNSNTSSISTNSGSSSSSNSSSIDKPTNEKEVVVAYNRELECVLNEDKTGYLIFQYKGKNDKYVKLPEKFYGLSIGEKTSNGIKYEVYSGENKFADDVLELPIVGILDYAFQSAGGILDIHFPDSYKEISDNAFVNCKSIENYFVNDTHEKYKSIDGVLYSKNGESLFAYPLSRKGKYEVIDGTKNISSGAFRTSRISEVVLPESIENIEPYSFYKSEIMKVNIPSKVKNIKEYTFNTCNFLVEVVFTAGLESIGAYAFQHCQLLSKFEFPSTLRDIGTSAFEQILATRKLTFNEGLVSIGDFAFAYNEYVDSITFPSTLKTIGSYAFIQNYRLKELNLVEGIEELKEGAFFYNTALEKVTIPASLHTIGFKSFSTSENGVKEYIVSTNSTYYTLKDKMVYTKDLKELVLAPVICEFENGKYVVPEGVEKIGDHAFYNNQSLRSITFPSTLKYIGRAPFYICNKLSTIEYNGSISDFALIETEDEIFTSTQTDEILAVKWYQKNESLGISFVTCNDGTYTLIETE